MPVPIDILWMIVEPAETIGSWLPMCDRWEVVEHEPPAAPLHRAAQPPARLAWKDHTEQTTVAIELQPAGGGTKVVLTSRSVPAGWWQRQVIRWIAAPRIRRSFDRALDRISRCGQE